MKFIVFICVVVLVIVSVSGASVNISPETSHECPFKEVDDSNLTLPNILGALLFECIEISDTVKKQLDDANTTEEYKVIFKDLCAKVPNTHNCMANVTAFSKECLNETDLTMFNLNLELMDLGIKMVCLEHGERIAGLLGDADECLSSRDHDNAEECINGTLAEQFSVDADDDSVVTLQPYKAMIRVRQCLVNNSEGCKRSVVEDGEAFINEFLTKMRCITQKTGEIVPCGDLEPNYNQNL